MKKVIVILMATLMILTMQITSFAKGKFIESPSVHAAPELVEQMFVPQDCEGYLVVTPYAERDTMPQEKIDDIEDAFDQILDKDNSKGLMDKIEEAANLASVPVEQVAVSDLFDISFYGCEEHNMDSHTAFDITLKAETFGKFVGVLHMHDGEWVRVEEAKLDESGKLLTMHIDELCPFAILVDAGVTPPATSDNSNIYFWVMLMSASALAIILLALNKKRV